MKRIALAAIVLALTAGAAAAWHSHDRAYTVEVKDTIHKTLKFETPGKPGSLSLDNVWGSIKVESAAGDEVDLDATRTIKAESKDKVEQAKSEVKLDITQKGGAIDVYVDGPFRCNCPDGGRGIKDRDLGYEVVYDFVLKVPRTTHVDLRNVNEGDVTVKGVQAGFRVHNVNGGVRLDDVAGSGEAGTINGGVSVGFTRNPEGACSFSTINGKVELAFQPGLAADFKLKTFNGEALTDFDVTLVPATVSPVPAKKEGGKFVYRQERFTQVRAGKGGPLITCDTLNGDIIIKKYGAR